MRPGAVTHSFNADQRLVGLSYELGVTPGTLTVTGPPGSAVAPPGWYMLFLIDTAGAVSVATFLDVS